MMTMPPIENNPQEKKEQRIIVLEVEASINGETQQEPDRPANDSSTTITKNGSLKRTRSQYEGDNDKSEQKFILADFAAVVAGYGWEFDVKLGENKASCLSSLQRWLAFEKRLREQSKTSYKVLSPRGTTITQTGIKGIHREGEYKCTLEILHPKTSKSKNKEGVPCLRLVEINQGGTNESEESEEDPDGENVHNIRVNSDLLWNIKNPNLPQRYVSPSDPFSFYPGPGRYQGI